MHNPSLHNRRSIRLKNYDYSGEGFYFITLCVAERIHLFGEIINGEMQLNKFGEIAKEEWAKTIEIRDNISLGEYIIMPNHLHGIIQINFQKENKNETYYSGKFHSPSQTIGAIIRGFKGATTKKINLLIREFIEKRNSTDELQFAPTSAEEFHFIDNFNLSGKGSIWQRNYYEHIIRTKRAYKNISNYIRSNPRNWGKDKFKSK